MGFRKQLSFLPALLILGFIVFLGACEEPDGIGLEVLPDGEEMPIAWEDSFTVVARSVFDSSVVTTGVTSFLIGDFGDPIFGRVRSQLFTQFLLSSSDVDFGPSPVVVDSVVLNLIYSGAYGSTDKLRGQMNWGVYKIDEDMAIQTYYSDTTHAVGDKIGEKQFRPDLYSNVRVGGDTLPPSLRIRLDPGFGTEIMNSNFLSSNKGFLTEFKGLNIRSDDPFMADGYGSILYFSLSDSRSRIELYYSNADTTGLMQSLVFVKKGDVDTIVQHASFTHEFPLEILDAVADSTVAGQDRLYIQSMAGVKIKVNIPHLRELNKLGTVVINRAEIVIPMDETVQTEYGHPNNLQITGISETGSSVFLVDFFEGGDYYGGAYDSEYNGFIFNIARHLQYILNHPEEEDRGLYILNSGNSVNARRAVFKGTAPSAPQDSTRRLKVKLTYSIIDS